MDMRRYAWVAAVVLGVGVGNLAHAGGTTSTTSTSASSTSTSSTTSTTVSACLEEDSLVSAQCRTLLLVGMLQQRGTTAPGNTVLTKQMNRVQKNLTEAAGLTGRKARNRYRRALSALKSFNVRLRSATGKKQVDQPTREALQGISRPLETTMRNLVRQPV